MIYFSHRGANTQRVQNTIDAFALAHQQGARCFELDVHLLKDGNLAVHHDYSLLSTAGVDVPLKELTAKTLHNYPLKNPFTQDAVYVSLLQDILPVITPRLELLNIELKNDNNLYPDLEETVLKAVPAEILPKVLFSSFDYESLKRLRTLAPTVRMGQLTRAFQVQEALDIGAESVHINHIRFTPQIAQTCHAHGLKVYCYTVNEQELAVRLAQDECDGIFTDKITTFIHEKPL